MGGLKADHKGTRLQSLLEAWGRPEGDCLGGLDFNFLTSLRVAANTRFPMRDLEGADTVEVEFVLSGNRILHDLDEGVIDLLGLLIGQVDMLCQAFLHHLEERRLRFCHECLFRHECSPF